MLIIKGKEGLKATWQEKFPKITKCIHCGENAYHAFTCFEGAPNDEDKNYICWLGLIIHKDKIGNKGHLWPHDACAIAIYFCGSCVEVTALHNEA